MNNTFPVLKRVDDPIKFGCSKFKSELENLLPPTILKRKEMKDLRMNKNLTVINKVTN
jgi:hypothetical protein